MFKFIYRNIYYRLLLAIETKINECLSQMVLDWDRKTQIEGWVYDPENERGSSEDMFEQARRVNIDFYTTNYRNTETRKKTFEEMKDMIEFLKN